MFDIAINGQTVQTNFDVLAQAGGPFTAIDMSYPVTVGAGGGRSPY